MKLNKLLLIGLPVLLLSSCAVYTPDVAVEPATIDVAPDPIIVGAPIVVGPGYYGGPDRHEFRGGDHDGGHHRH